MARRRVFRTRLKAVGCQPQGACEYGHLLGREVLLEKSSPSEVNVNLDGAVLARIDAALGSQLASALDRGQTFTTRIEHAFPLYNDEFRQTGAYVDIKVEYL